MPMSPDELERWRQPRPRLTLWIEDRFDEGWFCAAPRLLLFGVPIGIWAACEIWKDPGPVLATAATLLTVVGVRAYWRRKRDRQLLVRRIAGRCLGCGYDLRASPVRCPECGLERERGRPRHDDPDESPAERASLRQGLAAEVARTVDRLSDFPSTGWDSGWQVAESKPSGRPR